MNLKVIKCLFPLAFKLEFTLLMEEEGEGEDEEGGDWLRLSTQPI